MLNSDLLHAGSSFTLPNCLPNCMQAARSHFITEIAL